MTSTQDIIDALASPRRRLALRELHETGACTLRSLSTAVAAEENDKASEELEAQERNRVYIALYQSHLETLRELEMIEWSGDSNDPIVPTTLVEDAIDALDALERIANGRDQGYLGLLVGGLVGGDAA